MTWRECGVGCQGDGGRIRHDWPDTTIPSVPFSTAGLALEPAVAFGGGYREKGAAYRIPFLAACAARPGSWASCAGLSWRSTASADSRVAARIRTVRAAWGIPGPAAGPVATRRGTPGPVPGTAAACAAVDRPAAHWRARPGGCARVRLPAMRARRRSRRDAGAAAHPVGRTPQGLEWQRPTRRRRTARDRWRQRHAQRLRCGGQGQRQASSRLANMDLFIGGSGFQRGTGRLRRLGLDCDSSTGSSRRRSTHTDRHRRPAGSHDRPASLRRRLGAVASGVALTLLGGSASTVTGPASPTTPSGSGASLPMECPCRCANPAPRPAALPRSPGSATAPARLGTARRRLALAWAVARSSRWGARQLTWAPRCARRVRPVAGAAAGAWPAVHGYAPAPARPAGARPRRLAGHGHHAGTRQPAVLVAGLVLVEHAHGNALVEAAAHPQQQRQARQRRHPAQRGQRRGPLAHRFAQCLALPSRVQKRVGHCAIGRSLATAANARITATSVCSARAASPHCSSAITRARRSTPRRNATARRRSRKQGGTAVIGHSRGLPA